MSLIDSVVKLYSVEMNSSCKCGYCPLEAENFIALYVQQWSVYLWWLQRLRPLPPL